LSRINIKAEGYTDELAGYAQIRIDVEKLVRFTHYCTGDVYDRCETAKVK
jgi:hypothetical protein